MISDEDIGAAIRATAEQVSAPTDLRMRVDQQHEKAAAGRRRRLWAPLGAVAGLAAAAVLVVVLATGSDPAAPPAATLALRGPAASAPVIASDPRFMDQGVGGVPFPNYGWAKAAHPRWPAVGVRTGTVNGRRAVAVTYRRGTSSVGYAIVDGGALPWPEGKPGRTANGTPVFVSRYEDATVVTWRRGGHTCVLASRTVPASKLLAFVDWQV